METEARHGARAVDGLSFEVETRRDLRSARPERRRQDDDAEGPDDAGAARRPGTASVLGYDVVAHALEVRRRIVVVIQEHAAELFLTVRDNLLTFARFHGERDAAIAGRARQRDGASSASRRKPRRKVQDLSGGFRRRVQVAKVFMVETPIVFLDEFSTGMDPILKRSVMDLLRRGSRRAVARSC